METNAVTQVLTLNNISAWKKQELTDFAIASVAEVAENGDDILGLLAMAAKLEHFAGEVKKAAKGRGVTELAKFDKGTASKGGVKMVVKEVGVSYDYSKDANWNHLQADCEKADKALSECETFLKALPYEGRVIADEVTGELYRAYPPVRTAKESITATIL